MARSPFRMTRVPLAPSSLPDPDDPAPAVGVQGSFDDLGTPLVDTTFCVVDLETTGQSAARGGITEIGAVRVRGGVVQDRFDQLVNPGEAIPPFITRLTGITNAMVVSRPPIDVILPEFLSFASGCVLVAHNASFDVGFLRHNARRLGLAWPGFPVVDTLRLARTLVGRDEVPNRKLGTLAALFHATTDPTHRALADVLATVDVLHGLIGRLGSQGVDTLEELLRVGDKIAPAQRRKHHLADGLPDAPGCYMFCDDADRILYVGVSGNLRRRVKTYFTAGEQRSRMNEMLALATRVTPVVCPTLLEARVREVRLIAAHKPPYNRASRHPERSPWLRLTDEDFPRLSIVRRDGPGAEDGALLGPFGSHRAAEEAKRALEQAFPLRSCTTRVTAAALRRGDGFTPCHRGPLGRCGGPCAGVVDPAEYAPTVAAVRAAMTGDPTTVVETLRARMAELAAGQLYEDAARLRDRLLTFVRAASRTQRTAPLVGCRELVAARAQEDGGWEVAVVRRGLLAASGVSAPGADPWPLVAALRATGSVEAGAGGPGGTVRLAEETELIAEWLDRDDVRLVDIDGTWTCPVRGARIAEMRLAETGRRAGRTREFLGVLDSRP